MVVRVRRIEIVLLALALTLALFAAVGAVAQTQSSDDDRRESSKPTGHSFDVRRVERQVDALQTSHEQLKLNIEVRLTKIETYVTALLWLGGVIGALLFGQLGKNLLDLIAVRRGAQSKE